MTDDANNTKKKAAWQLGKRDMVFVAIITAVILLLVLGTGDRTTKAVPSDAMHQQVTSRTQCMACHGVDGVKPQPIGHSKADQCFQCHTQPKAWKKFTP